jgi:hypothetical protein
MEIKMHETKVKICKPPVPSTYYGRKKGPEVVEYFTALVEL